MNDLISRKDALETIHECMYELQKFNGEDAVVIDFDDAINRITALPAVPQQMSAVEYARNFAQMCRSHTCGKCPFHESEKFGAESCVKFEREYPEEAVAIVQKWAAGSKE